MILSMQVKCKKYTDLIKYAIEIICVMKRAVLWRVKNRCTTYVISHSTYRYENSDANSFFNMSWIYVSSSTILYLILYYIFYKYGAHVYHLHEFRCAHPVHFEFYGISCPDVLYVSFELQHTMFCYAVHYCFLGVLNIDSMRNG